MTASASFLLASAPKPQAELRPLAPIDAALTAPGAPFELTHALLDNRIQPLFPLQQRTTLRDAVLASMRAFPQRTHIVYGPHTRYTYADSLAAATRLALALRAEYAVRKGDRVAVLARNTPHFALAVFAAFLLGAIVVPINAFAEGPTLAFCIADADARVVLCDAERWARLTAAPAALPDLARASRSLQAIVVSPWKLDDYLPRHQRPWLTHPAGPIALADWDDLDARGAALHAATPDPHWPHLDHNDFALILYTSGTTGMPKGVLSRHRQVLAGSAIGGIHIARAFLRRGQIPPVPAAPHITAEDACPSTLTLSPLFHVTGLSSGLLSATMRGGRIVFLPAYSAQRALDTIKRERVKLVSGVGFMVREILRIAQPGDLDSLEAVSHGGASAANDIPAESQARKRGLATTNGYGMSETNGLVLGSFLDEYMADPASIGHPVPSVEVRILDPDTGHIIQDNRPGELLIRSPCNATGYWRRPKESAETFLADGFVRTGDLARREASGYVYIMDRLKEVIIRGGENVSCASVEGAVYRDARVLECAAVGVPDERLGERVGLIVVVHPSTAAASLDAPAVQALARSGGLPRFALPEVVWVRTEPLAKNANGKVVKRELKRELLAWMKAEGRGARL